MYGGVPNIADRPMSYTYGDNIYFDVRPLLAMQMSASSNFLQSLNLLPSRDTGIMRLEQTSELMRWILQKTLSALDKMDWAHGHLCGALGHNVLHEKMSFLVQLAPEAEAGDAPEQNYYVYVIPQYHLPGIFW